MPLVTIPLKILTKGRLPPVCVMTGEPDVPVRQVLLTTSLAKRVLLPWGWLLADKLLVRIPMNNTSFRRMRVAQWTTVPALLMLHFVGLIALLSLLGNLWLAAAGYLLLLVVLWVLYSRLHVPQVPTIDLTVDQCAADVVLLKIPEVAVADGIRTWLDTLQPSEELA